MTTNTLDSLIAKALRTDSEDEAIACLRQARKKVTSTTKLSASTYSGKDAEYWYQKALLYYRSHMILTQRVATLENQISSQTETHRKNRERSEDRVRKSNRLFVITFVMCILLLAFA